MVYCDSSFLASLYILTDGFNERARRETARFTQAIPYTLLNELELLNVLHRALGNRCLDLDSHAAILREIHTDETEGLLVRTFLNQVKLYSHARDLSKKYASDIACRALDILHVASAVILGAKRLASFDYRQRKLADAIGLSLVPHSMS